MEEAVTAQPCREGTRMDAFLKGFVPHWSLSLPGEESSAEGRHLCNLENRRQLTVTHMEIVCHFPGVWGVLLSHI